MVVWALMKKDFRKQIIGRWVQGRLLPFHSEFTDKIDYWQEQVECLKCHSRHLQYVCGLHPVNWPLLLSDLQERQMTHSGLWHPFSHFGIFAWQGLPYQYRCFTNCHHCLPTPMMWNDLALRVHFMQVQWR